MLSADLKFLNLVGLFDFLKQLNFWKKEAEKTKGLINPNVVKSAQDLAGKINVGVVEKMLEATNCGGKNFCERLYGGFPILGIFDEPGVYPRRERSHPVTSRKELLKTKIIYWANAPDWGKNFRKKIIKCGKQ